MLPSALREYLCKIKNQREVLMNPKIITLPSIKLAGYSWQTTIEAEQQDKDVPKFWNDYYAEGKAKKIWESDIFEKPIAEYGTCLPTTTNEVTYVIGAKVKDGADIPDDFFTCDLPQATYAVWSVKKENEDTFVKNIQATFQHIFNEWFPVSGYVYGTEGANFELYTVQDGIVTCDIHIPIIRIKDS